MIRNCGNPSNIPNYLSVDNFVIVWPIILTIIIVVGMNWPSDYIELLSHPSLPKSMKGLF